jgi:outer membrane protein assembly factor BamA
LEQIAHSTLFGGNRSYPRNPRNAYQICYDPKLGTAVCDKVKVNALEATYEWDARDYEQATQHGYWMRGSGEWSRRSWGSDIEYNRYWADARIYRMISPKQHVAVRIKSGVLEPTGETCECTPAPQYFFPKQFYVGGIGTLPGYGYKQFQGTHLFLANLEYAYDISEWSSLVFFANGGDAMGLDQAERGDWAFWDTFSDMKFKVDAGVGLRHESPGDYSFTIGFAQGLTKLYRDDDRPVVVTIRGTRMF